MTNDRYEEEEPGDRDGDRGKRPEGPGDPMSDRAERDLSSTQIFSAIGAEPEADESTQDLGARLAEQVPPGAALLVVRRGPNAGSRFLLDTDVTTAGRHPESDIFLDDVTVSR